MLLSILNIVEDYLFLEPKKKNFFFGGEKISFFEKKIEKKNLEKFRKIFFFDFFKLFRAHPGQIIFLRESVSITF